MPVAELEFVRWCYVFTVNNNPFSATDHIAAWLASHRDQIGGTQLKFIRQDTYGRTLCAEFETAKHLIQFCAWDQGCCLDIIALDKDSPSDAYAYSVAGECDGSAGLSERLQGFLSWLAVHDLTRTT